MHRLDMGGLRGNSGFPLPGHLLLGHGNASSTPGQEFQRQKQGGIRELEGSQKFIDKLSTFLQTNPDWV
jgi:hypothetical protein